MKKVLAVILLVCLGCGMLTACNQKDNGGDLAIAPTNQNEETIAPPNEEELTTGLVAVWLLTSESNYRDDVHSESLFSYNEEGLVTEHIKKTDGNETWRKTYTYNDMGIQKECVVTQNGNETWRQTDSYNAQGLLEESLTYRNKVQTKSLRYEYYESGIIKQETLTDEYGDDIKEYDENGNMIRHYSSLNPGEFHTYAYDSAGNMIEHLEYSNDKLMATRLYTYDDAGQLAEEKADCLWEESYHYRYIYDNNGNITCMEAMDQNGVDVIRYTWYSYDENGNLLGWRDEHTFDVEGSYVVYTYDEGGRMLTKSGYINYYPHRIGGYDYEYTYTYDDNGNLIREEGREGENVQPLYTWVYDDNGNVIERTVGTTRSVYTFDANGNRTEAVYYTAGIETSRTTWTYEKYLLTPEQAEQALIFQENNS